MTPGEIQGTIDEIVEGLESWQRRRLLAQGNEQTTRPFVFTFGDDVSDAEMFRILQTVREQFPQYTIHGTRG